MTLLAALRAPLRAARPARANLVLARNYSPSAWTSPQATESEADVRADRVVKEKPGPMLQEETIDELHERTDEEEYNEALKHDLKVRAERQGEPTASEEFVRADRVSVRGKPGARLQEVTRQHFEKTKTYE